MYNSKTESKVFDIRDRTFKFGVEIVKLVMILPKNIAGNAIGNQLIRSGTSIGANVEEAQNSGSRKEFIHGLTIALKEARETDYWLRITDEIGLIGKLRLKFALTEIKEIIKILTAIIKKTKNSSKV